MPSPGEMYGGRYRLDDRIAAGGMGEVWRATDTVLGRDVAVKMLHTERAGDSSFQTRFRNEARAMAALHHPGVADVYDFGETEGGTDAFIVMARIDGEALNQRIASRGRLSVDETLSVVSQAGRALQAAHQAGIVHRDVKPGNLIIEEDGTVVLVDFGVARQADSVTMTGAGEVVGTAMYIAPEQVSKEPITPAVDVYALGVVAYHCLTGHPPFLGDNPVAIAMQHLNEPPPPLPDDVPPAVRMLVLRAMEKRPQDRFPSAAAMADAADRLLSGEGADTTAILAMAPPAASRRPTTATAPLVAATATDLNPGGMPPPPNLPAGGPPPPGGRRNRKPLIAAVAGVLVLAAAGTALALAWPDNDTPAGTQPSATVPASVGAGNAPATTTTRPRPTSKPTTTRSQAPVNPSSSAPVSSAPSSSASSSPSATPTTEPPTSATPAEPTGGENEPDENEPEEGGNEPAAGGNEPAAGGN
jgi:serine/threonine protein kinase